MVRLLIVFEQDISRLNALGETMLRFRKIQSMPRTVLISRILNPTLVLLTKTPISLVNVDACKSHNVTVCRCALDAQPQAAVLFRSDGVWEIHVYDQAEGELALVSEEQIQAANAKFNAFIFDFLESCGLKGLYLEGNDVMIGGRKIGSFGARCLGQGVFTYFCNFIVDFPDWIDELYVNPKHLPSQYLTSLRRLGVELVDSEIVSRLCTSYQKMTGEKLELGELDPSEVDFQKIAQSKYIEEWNLYGDQLYSQAWINWKALRRSAQTRYCKNCVFYAECLITTEDRLSFCKRKVDSLLVGSLDSLVDVVEFNELV